MGARLYRLIRNLHLFFGLFLSPFALVFAVSVFFLVHRWLPGFAPSVSTTRVVSDLPLPENVKTLSGRALIDALRPALDKAEVHGEVGFVRQVVKEDRFIIPVMVPGRTTTVSLSVAKREASIEWRETGVSDALVLLHKSPGQHLVNIRMNWFYMRLWRWCADATVYLLMFITVSGIYLWSMLRAERRVGLTLLVAGALSFFGMAYALSH